MFLNGVWLFDFSASVLLVLNLWELLNFILGFDVNIFGFSNFSVPALGDEKQFHRIGHLSSDGIYETSGYFCIFEGVLGYVM